MVEGLDRPPIIMGHSFGGTFTEQRTRRQLTEPRAIEPGERLEVVIQIVASAERLAQTLHDHCLTAAALSEART